MGIGVFTDETTHGEDCDEETTTMTVIPLHRDRDQRPPAVSAVPAVTLPRDEVQIHGTFRSPTGRAGTMTGSYRLEHLEALAPGSDHALMASGVFTGLLVDADGTLVGRGSRRKAAPVETAPPHLVLGPVDVDLLGLTVHVTAVRFHPPVEAVSAPGASRWG